MKNYRLLLALKTGETVTGKAITTKIIDKQEFIVIEAETQSNENPSSEREIRLDQINTLTALDVNAQFTTIEIN